MAPAPSAARSSAFAGFAPGADSDQTPFGLDPIPTGSPANLAEFRVWCGIEPRTPLSLFRIRAPRGIRVTAELEAEAELEANAELDAEAELETESDQALARDKGAGEENNHGTQ
jgi:hypothetical protein